VVRAGRGVLAVLLLFLISAVGGSNTTGDLIRLATVGLALILGFISWLVTRWRLADGVLQIDTGLLRKSSLRYPLTQIQAIDIVRPGLARVLGMAELRLRMAGAGGSSGKLAYLTTDEADTLRAQLLAIAHGLDEGVPAPPEQALYQVNSRQLIGSLLLRGPAVGVMVAIVVLVVLALVAPGAAGATLSASGTVLLGAVAGIWQRFNGEYHLTVAEAPDGLRLRAGLVETSAETIPRGRVQALRLIQPLTWRPFGWFRVEVDLAGRGTSGRQNRAAKRASRALMPVGSLEQATWLIDRIMPGLPAERRRPPIRARWKSPFRYPQLSYATNELYAVTTSGRLRRVTDSVPLAKVQSIRQVEGPFQRRLKLASIHLDTAGRSVFAVLRDRDASEAEVLMATLPDACRRARDLETGIGTGR
jgi:putative membrane protein